MKYPTILLLSAMIFILGSCREKIELTLDSSFTRLVVEGSISDEAKAHTVTLTLTSDYFYDGQPPPASGAQVEISDGIQTFLLIETTPGIYQTDPSAKGVPGRNYTLTIRGLDVDKDGEMETYTATDLLKSGWMLDSVVAIQQNPGELPATYKINGWGLEPATPDDCYQWVYYLNGKLQSDTLSKTRFTDDTFFNGSYLPGLTMFADIIAQKGDTITAETRSLSRPYYTFLITFMLEAVWNQGGGSGPPANIKSNVSNGAMGYFSAFSVTRVSAVVE